MTEAEWLACPDPWRHLWALPVKVSGRKHLLMAVACCRMLDRLLTDWRERRAVGLAEQFADGDASEEELSAAARPIRLFRKGSARHLAWLTARGRAREAASAAVELARRHHPRRHHRPDAPSPVATLPEQRVGLLVRDIVGNPFRRPTISPDWLAWNGGTVGNIAWEIYDDRAFDHLPVLADALEDAGCADAELLCHCREPGDHVRGCWVIDLLLNQG
jgi:hypothetical protein